jgi:endonuclease/exonuclease/phosphatase family metal-dependent hydrolase
MTSDHSLRLATWNIHRAVGTDGQRDLARTAAVIREISADVIALQEVDNRVCDEGDDLKELARMTGLQVIAGPTMQKASGDYGNVILTNLPIQRIARHAIGVPDREPRGILIVHLDWQGKPLHVANTHLGLLPAERRKQVRSLIEALANYPPPLVLMGDFNEWLFWGRPLRWLRSHFGRIPSPATFPSRLPLLKLDHILCEPRQRLQSLTVDKSPLARDASDHLPLLANYRTE